MQDCTLRPAVVQFYAALYRHYTALLCCSTDGERWGFCTHGLHSVETLEARAIDFGHYVCVNLYANDQPARRDFGTW